MHFLIKTRNAPDTNVDDGVRAAHRAYIAENAEQILAVGLTTAEAADRPEGSAYILEAEDWNAARAFMEDDPLTQSGARASLEFWEWMPRGFNRQFPLSNDTV